MVLGILKGYSDPKDGEHKKQHYALVREFAERFKEQNGSYICRELLSGVNVTPGGDPEPRSASFYERRPCPILIRDAAVILDEILSRGGDK